MISVIFRAFRAIDEPATCQKFINGHRKVLEAHGITMITSNNAEWMSHKNTYVILAEAPDDKRALGGARIQIADDDLKLPIVEAVGKVDPKIEDVINRHSGFTIAEACGLWNSKEIAGYGYSFFMLRATIALAYHQKVDILYALAAPVTVKMCLNAGFNIERTLGKDGFFNYPKLDLVATAMLINDLAELKSATPEDREHVLRLIQDPEQIINTSGPKGEVTIDYRLLLQNEVF